MQESLSVLVIGCGTMGTSHALAYRDIPEFEIVGLVSRGKSRDVLNQRLGGGHALFSDYSRAIDVAKPDLVSINTFSDSHEEIALHAFQAGAHVFLEKPIAPTVNACQRVVQAAQSSGRKLVVGYILRHHPSWVRFIEIAQGLGRPLVMRMNLNQQSSGVSWEGHKNLMLTTSPIVDCGVHYVDVMCQMTRAQPIRVSAIGARLTDELVPGMYNYGQLQVAFDDGSVGWYEAGWGPMMSETAYFVKDVVGPRGSVSIVATKMGRSDNIDAHTQTQTLRVHHSDTDAQGNFVHPDEVIDMTDEPDHNELCKREQLFLLKAIQEDLDLTSHWQDAVNSSRIVLAADESIRTGKTIKIAPLDRVRESTLNPQG
jgi:predicted dehydrogenase